MDDSLLSPMEAGPTQLQSREAFSAQHSVLPFDRASMFLKFSEMLDHGLSSTAAKITGEIKADIQNLGSCMEPTESKLDATVTSATQNTDRIQDLQDQLETALSKIDNLENRS